MAYLKNIPRQSTAPRDASGYILENFRSIDDYLGIDHYSFGHPNEGKHKKLSLKYVNSEAFRGGVILYHGDSERLLTDNYINTLNFISGVFPTFSTVSFPNIDVLMNIYTDEYKRGILSAYKMGNVPSKVEKVSYSTLSNMSVKCGTEFFASQIFSKRQTRKVYCGVKSDNIRLDINTSTVILSTINTRFEDSALVSGTFAYVKTPLSLDADNNIYFEIEVTSTFGNFGIRFQSITIDWLIVGLTR